MGFRIPEEDSASAEGYVTTGAFNAREIVQDLARKFEEEWNVTDSAGFREYGDSFKVTITVQKV